MNMNFNFNPVNKNNAPQEPEPSRNKETGLAKVTLRVDADCFLLCDGEYMEDIEIVANKITKVQLPIGQHLLEFMDLENPDIKVERAVDFPEEGKSYLVLVDGLEEAIAEANEKKASVEAERKAREEAERKAKEDAERKAKAELESRAKAEAERKAKAEAERKAREEAERKVQAELESRAKALAEAKARKDITYTITIGDVTNMLKATMTARALFKWSTAEAKEKFADIPFDVLTTKSQTEATEMLQALNNGGIVADILAVNALDEIVDIKELTEQKYRTKSDYNNESINRARADEEKLESCYNLGLTYEGRNYNKMRDYLFESAVGGYMPAVSKLAELYKTKPSLIDRLDDEKCATLNAIACSLIIENRNKENEKPCAT